MNFGGYRVNQELPFYLGYNLAMRARLLVCAAMATLSSGFSLAGQTFLRGDEDIPKLMMDSTLVCKGEVIDAPEAIGVLDVGPTQRTATAFVHVDRCFKGEEPAGEVVPVLFDNRVPSGGSSGGRLYVILRKNDGYSLFFLKPQWDNMY